MQDSFLLFIYLHFYLFFSVYNYTYLHTRKHLHVRNGAIKQTEARIYNSAHIEIGLRTTYKRHLLHTRCDVMIFIYIPRKRNEENERVRERVSEKKKDF